jgi:hypothetical protein
LVRWWQHERTCGQDVPPQGGKTHDMTEFGERG